MKTLLLTCFLLMAGISIKAQNTWCPPGAKWYYSSYCFGLNEAKKTVTYVKDTVLNAVSCKCVKMELTCAPPQNGTYSGYYYTYESNKVIYVYNANGAFDTLFNFNAAIGDKWLRHIACPGAVGDTNSCNYRRSTVDVLDTGHVVINAVNLKKLVLKNNQIVTNFNNDTMHIYTIDTVYEKIGSLYNGWCSIMSEPRQMQIDAPFNGTFRCYVDSSFTLYHKAGMPACDTLAGVGIMETTNTNGPMMRLFPNPSNGNVFVEYNAEHADAVIHISDVNGKIMSTYLLPSSENNRMLEGNKFENGIYFYSVTENGKTIKAGKLVIIK